MLNHKLLKVALSQLIVAHLYSWETTRDKLKKNNGQN